MHNLAVYENNQAIFKMNVGEAQQKEIGQKLFDKKPKKGMDYKKHALHDPLQILASAIRHKNQIKHYLPSECFDNGLSLSRSRYNHAMIYFKQQFNLFKKQAKRQQEMNQHSLKEEEQRLRRKVTNDLVMLKWLRESIEQIVQFDFMSAKVYNTLAQQRSVERNIQYFGFVDERSLHEEDLQI